MRTYSELCEFDTIQERFEYLRLDGGVGDTTFDDMRWVNQNFYHGSEWRRIRQHIIARDLGNDLGTYDLPIRDRYPLVHHMNPITLEDIEEGTDNLFDPEFLICTGLRTHNAIHFGNELQLPTPYVERSARDHLEWEGTSDDLRNAISALRSGASSRR